MTNEEQVYISGLRYALGRKTYIVSATVHFLLKKELSPSCKRIMISDIKEAFREENVGMEMDAEQWSKLLVHLEK